jgi:hypothetical protein
MITHATQQSLEQTACALSKDNPAPSHVNGKCRHRLEPTNALAVKKEEDFSRQFLAKL